MLKCASFGFPNGKDKLVQEAIRIILECIYEPTFSNLSHGFRPKRSTQSAIAEVETWKGTIWFIEGDISACFDEIDHRTLETILRERISDERFIRLINKILKADYFDMQHIYHGTKTENAQGSCCSPILCNIYLDKLDRFMENMIETDTSGGYRRQNPDYAKAKACSVSLALYKSFARQKDFFDKIKLAVKSFLFLPEYNLINPLTRVCCICGNPHLNVSMYHRKTKKKLDKPYSPIVTVMLAINRHQIPLCAHCFANVEADRLYLLPSMPCIYLIE